MPEGAWMGLRFPDRALHSVGPEIVGPEVFRFGGFQRSHVSSGPDGASIHQLPITASSHESGHRFKEENTRRDTDKNSEQYKGPRELR